MKKAQLATQNLILSAFILFSIIILFYYAIDYSASNFRVGQIEDTVNNLVITARAVHEFGPGNQEEATVSMPKGARIYGDAKSIAIARESGDPLSLKYLVPFEVVGYVPAFEGISTVTVKSIDDFTVQIGHWPHITGLSPNPVQFTDLPLNITIHGEELTPDMEVFVDDVVYTDRVDYVDEQKIQFYAPPSYFKPPPTKTLEYEINLRDSTGYVTNSDTFIVIGPAL